MKKITLILPYYENPGMLRHQLETILSYSDVVKSQLDVTIIDDGSPRNPAKIDLKTGIKIRLFRTKVDVPWNQDFCRNLGVVHARTPWVLLTDMDHVVPQETFENLIRNEFKTFVAYKFSRRNAPNLDAYKPHPNSWFMTRELYQSIGGYDERFAGWYGTDGDFRNRIEKHATITDLPYPGGWIIWRVISYKFNKFITTTQY